MALSGETGRLLMYDEAVKEGWATKVRLPMALLQETDRFELHRDLYDTHIDVCTPELLVLLQDNFDWQDLRRDLLPWILRRVRLRQESVDLRLRMAVDRVDERLEVAGPRVVRHELERRPDAQRGVLGLTESLGADLGPLEVQIRLRGGLRGDLELEREELEDEAPVLLDPVDRARRPERLDLSGIELERALIAHHRLLVLPLDLFVDASERQADFGLDDRISDHRGPVLEGLNEGAR